MSVEQWQDAAVGRAGKLVGYIDGAYIGAIERSQMRSSWIATNPRGVELRFENKLMAQKWLRDLHKTGVRA